MVGQNFNDWSVEHADFDDEDLPDNVQFTKSYFADCTDLQFIYARGSGQENSNSEEWRQFEKEMRLMAERGGYTYKIFDLNYQAIGIDKPSVAVGAFVSAGKAFAFGRSVQNGVDLINEYRAAMDLFCRSSYWVLMGYSQGAMVVMNALPKFNPERVAFVGLLGDPNTYLPEGKGPYPPACRGEWYSPYRVYVPECRTDEGILGERNPYVPPGFEGRVGLWCNKKDIICGSTHNVFDMDGHSQYRTNGSIREVAMYARRSLLTNNIQPGVSQTANVTSMRTALPLSGELKASLPVAHYYAEPGEVVTFDASQSFSILPAGELIYEWDFSDDGKTVLGGQTMQHSFAKPGEYAVSISLANGLARSESFVATVTVSDKVQEQSFPTLPIADEFEIRRDGDHLKIAWSKPGPEEANLLLKINNYPLSIVKSCARKIELTDMEFDQGPSLQLAWTDSEFNVGEEIEYDLSKVKVYDEARDGEIFKVAECCGDTATTEPAGSEDADAPTPTPPEAPVPTGVVDRDTTALALIMATCCSFALVMRLRKFMHQKTAP